MAHDDRSHPAIHDFVRDPSTFLSPKYDHVNKTVASTVVSSFNVFPAQAAMPVPGGVPNQGYFYIILDHDEPMQRTFEIKYYGAERGRDTVWAYNLGYNGGAQTSRRPAFIDIPKHVPENTLLFTGTLSGCSVIVTNLNDTTFRVFHDTRADSSLLYDNVEMAVDYSDYSVHADAGMACVFMQYRNDQWTMFVQLQILKPLNQKTIVVQRGTEMYHPFCHSPTLEGVGQMAIEEDKAMHFEDFRYFPLILLQPGSYDASRVRASFDVRRESSREHLRSIASEALAITNIPNVPDGDFRPFEGNQVTLRNAAVSRSQALRDVIKQAGGDIFRRYDMAKEQNPSVLQGQITALKASVDPTVKESRDLDLMYLWIKQKEARGLDAVVITDQWLEAPLGSTVGERFAGQQLDTLLAGDTNFTIGYKYPDIVEVPGLSNDMTSLEMVWLSDLSANLTQTERGALVYRICNARRQEFMDRVWQQTDRVVKMFQDAGGWTKPMPQDILLSVVPDEYGGRCYPLVRAMSVALAQSDLAVDQLSIKLLALSSSSNTDDRNAVLFRRCLKDLHASYPAAEASTLIGRTNLRDAASRLSVEEGGSVIFALNTDIHAMLLGATNTGGRTSYHFYDPNFAIATFDSQQELVDATTKFFTELEFGQVYGADASSSDPIFTLVRLDTDKMADIGFDFNLNVADFAEPETLAETIEFKAGTELRNPRAARLAEIHALKVGVDLVDALELVEAWHDATARLEASTGIGDHWMPLLGTLTEVDGRAHSVQFINLQNPDETRWVTHEDPAIKHFKVYLDERLKALSEAYRYESGTFVQKEGLASAEAIDGLNAMFVVKTLIEHLDHKNHSSLNNGSTNANLVMAIKVQGYLNLTQLGQQSLHDVAKMVQLTQTLLRSEQAAQSSLSSISIAIGRISEGLGIALNFANVALDVYMLNLAQTETQKAVYGTQLAFDSASLLAGVGSVGAGMLGASTTAAVLGGTTVLLAGLSIGGAALAEAFGAVADHSEVVGRYFGDTEDAYKAGGYKYDQENKTLVPLIGAVISELDVIAGNVQFDSQYIFRSRHRTLGPPDIVRDKSQAINVREGIGAPASGKLANTTDYTTIILPATPKSYIDYDFNILPFSTFRHDNGFDVIRRLEVDEKFEFTFWSFPCERIIDRISHEYVKTMVAVKLDGRSTRIQAPHLPDNMHNVLTYMVHGANAGYTVGLMAGVGISLSSTSKTRWILDCRDLTDSDATIEDDSIVVSGVRVTIADRNFLSMLALMKNGEVLNIDFNSGCSFPVLEDASKFPGGGPRLLEHLSHLNAKHLLRGMFIVVEDCTIPSGQAVGRAFYDITNTRLLYTVNAPLELTADVQVVAVANTDEVYFYNAMHTGAIWRVDPATGSCLAKYKAPYSSCRKLMRVWQEHDYVHALFRYPGAGDDFGELGYILQADSMKLVSMVGDSNLLYRLRALDKWEHSNDQLLQAYSVEINDPPLQFSSLTDDMPGKDINATVDTHMLFVFGLDKKVSKNFYLHARSGNVDGYYYHYEGNLFRVTDRFWIRFTDRAIIRPAFSQSESDIVLAGSITPPFNGNVEEIFFYSPREQRIFIQKGTGRRTTPGSDDLEPVRSVIVPPEFGNLSNVLCINNEMFVITMTGFVLRLTSQGALFLEAVSREWFSQFKSGELGPWWTVLKDIAERHGATAVAILGLRGADNVVVPTWFCSGRIVIASSPLPQQQFQIAGLTRGGCDAWLVQWNPEGTGQLYSQPLVPEDQLSSILSPNSPDVMSDKVPQRMRVLESHLLKKVVVTGNGLQCGTTDGVTLFLLDKDTVTLYGVDKGWQRKHLSNLEADLGDLWKDWSHGEVIVLQGCTPATTPAWYVPSAGGIVTVATPDLNPITWDDNPLWLGTDVRGTAGYIYLVSRGIIYSLGIDQRARAVLQEVTLARRLQDVLVLVHARESSFSLFAMKNVRYGVLYQSDGKADTICTIPQASWAHYSAIVVEWRGSGGIDIEAHSSRGDTGSFLAKNIGNDLVIVDVFSGRSLRIRKAFCGDHTFASVSVRFASLDFAFIPADVYNAQVWLRNVAKLESGWLPDVTLRTIGYHLSTSRSRINSA